MFENLSAVLDENEESLLDPLLKPEITQHLRSLESELNIYFTEFAQEEWKLVRNPFSGIFDITTIPSEVQDEFLDLKYDSAVKFSMKKNLRMYSGVQCISHIQKSVRLHFAYSCLFQLPIKNTSRNRLDVDPDIRYALLVAKPRIRQLTEKKQCHPSH